MTNDDRLNRVESDVIDLKLAVSALLEAVKRHQLNFETSQRNFERLYTEIRDLRTDTRTIQAEIRDIQTDIRGLQTENRRILDILQHREDQNGDR